MKFETLIYYLILVLVPEKGSGLRLLMKNFPQKLSWSWWLGNVRYFIYFVREFSGVVIALYVTYLLYALYNANIYSDGMFARDGEIYKVLVFVDYLKKFWGFEIFSWIALIFALIHTVTWFWVSAKLAPPNASTVRGSWQFPKFIGLFIAWAVLSFFIYTNLYIYPQLSESELFRFQDYSDNQYLFYE